MKRILKKLSSLFSGGNSQEQRKNMIDWVTIPAGTFIMGSPLSEIGRQDNEIQHEVTLDAFQMSKFPITFEQYDLFCKSTGSPMLRDKEWGRGKRPLINVTWHEANAFAKWMKCRLPTEAEWEYACRSGTTTPFNTGNTITTSQANFNGYQPYNNGPTGEVRQKTLPVGSFLPNTFGLYDMHDNVEEWCNDWYGDYPSSAQTNPQGPSNGKYRVWRGGGFGSDAAWCRSANRRSNLPEDYFYRSFRIVY
jgi:formylglycine-generating enzyme